MSGHRSLFFRRTINARHAAATSPTLGTPVTASNASQSSASAWTWNHTVASGDKVLVVMVSSSAPTLTASPVLGVTYGGVALTKSGTALSAASNGLARSADIYTLVNPAVGTAAVSVSLNTANAAYSIVGTSVAVRNASGGVGSQQTAVGASVTSLSTSTTSSGGILFGCAGIRSSTGATVGGGETVLNSAVVNTSMQAEHTWQASGTAQVTSVSWTTADQGALVAVPIT